MWQTLWRWHFLSGVLAIPLALFLSITGAVYLVAPQIEHLWNPEAYSIQVSDSLLSWDTQKKLVQQKYPNFHTHKIYPPEILHKGEGRTSTLVEFIDKERIKYVVDINPYTGKVYQHQEQNKTVLRRLKKLHGELLLGNWGTKLVELTACWMILLVISGLYLWSKKPLFFIRKSSWKHLLIKTHKTEKRQAWKEVHLVVGFYTSFFLLLFLITGLPWTSVWGDGLKYVQGKTNQKAPAGRFFNPYKSDLNSAFILQNNTGDTPVPLGADAITSIGRQQGIVIPTAIEFPKSSTGSYALHHKTVNPTDYRVIHLDQYTGKILSDVSFKDYPILARWISIGILIHQGEYFGRINFIWALSVVFFTCILCISAIFMWWQRRPQNGWKQFLGIPPKSNKPVPKSLYAILAFMGLFFPLVGLSLLVYSIVTYGYSFFKKKYVNSVQ
jgi:uncharacterized iron-regulated membrane protein